MGAFGSKSHQRMPHQKSVVTAEKTHYHCGPGRAKALPTTVPGEVAEWSNVPDSKSGVGESQPWVRIPPSPPNTVKPLAPSDPKGHWAFFVWGFRVGQHAYASTPPSTRHKSGMWYFR